MVKSLKGQFDQCVVVKSEAGEVGGGSPSGPAGAKVKVAKSLFGAFEEAVVVPAQVPPSTVLGILVYLVIYDSG